jgi:hypothetical protein
LEPEVIAVLTTADVATGRDPGLAAALAAVGG